MRLHVELEDGKAEDVFFPLAGYAALQTELGESPQNWEMVAFAAWWAFDRRGLCPTDVKDWRQFADVATATVLNDADPKAPTTKRRK